MFCHGSIAATAFCVILIGADGEVQSSKVKL